MARIRSIEDRINEARERLRDLQDRKKLKDMRERVRSRKRTTRR
jgi:hypothetical protein